MLGARYAAKMLSILGYGDWTSAQNMKLWYNRPAQDWLEALPLGNSRLGAMVFGGTAVKNCNSMKRRSGLVDRTIIIILKGCRYCLKYVALFLKAKSLEAAETH